MYRTLPSMISPRTWGAIAFVGIALSKAYAQGMLPAPTASTHTLVNVQAPLRIGDTVPPILAGIDENGKNRSLVSYKSSLDVLVMAYVSAGCAQNESLVPQLKRLEEEYAGWHTAFVVMTPEETIASTATLFNAMRQKHLDWPFLLDQNRTAATLLGVTGTPTLVIIDEFGQLRYRGPLQQVRKALNTLISHTDAVKDPEPALPAACPL